VLGRKICVGKGKKNEREKVMGHHGEALLILNFLNFLVATRALDILNLI
jgi:hypothetical protein